jgi:hypothetical protein
MFYLGSAGIFALCALVLLFLGRIEAASLTIFATFGFLCFRGPFKGLEGATFRELFSDDATHKLDPLLLAGFLGFFVALYLAVKIQVAAAGAVFTASLSALGVAKGSASGVAKAQINHTSMAATTVSATTITPNPTPTISPPEAPKMGG